MNVEELRRFLERHRRVGLDTPVFIYHAEGNKKYSVLANLVFAWIEAPGHRANTSTVTMMELLVQPYRLADPERVDRLYSLFSTYPHLEWVAPTLAIADRAARLQAEHRLTPPDALQAATAMDRRASGFITDDVSFRNLPDLEVVILDDLLVT